MQNLVGSLKQTALRAGVCDLEANDFRRHRVPTLDGGFVRSRPSQVSLFHLPGGLLKLALGLRVVDNSSGKPDGESIGFLIRRDAPENNGGRGAGCFGKPVDHGFAELLRCSAKTRDCSRVDRPPENRGQVWPVVDKSDDPPEQDRPDRLSIQKASGDRRISPFGNELHEVVGDPTMPRQPRIDRMGLKE